MNVETRIRIIQRHIDLGNMSYHSKEAFKQIVEILKEMEQKK